MAVKVKRAIALPATKPALSPLMSSDISVLRLCQAKRKRSVLSSGSTKTPRNLVGAEESRVVNKPVLRQKHLAGGRQPFTGPAFAGDVTTAKTQANCEKAGGMWDAATSKRSEKKM
jgi:hypothetical protein